MSDKPREFWISKCLQVVATENIFIEGHWDQEQIPSIHVIEYSAYETVCKERDEMLVAQSFSILESNELKEERNKIRAELGKANLCQRYLTEDLMQEIENKRVVAEREQILESKLAICKEALETIKQAAEMNCDDGTTWLAEETLARLESK